MTWILDQTLIRPLTLSDIVVTQFDLIFGFFCVFCLLLNSKKTKELIVDFRKKKGGAHTHIYISGDVVALRHQLQIPTWLYLACICYSH